MGLLKFMASVLGVMSPVHIGFVTAFSGAKKVGIDQLGNKYYSAAPRPGYKRERRWVMYKGAPEATSVPPEWHGWLHHQTDRIPGEDAPSYRRDWQKPHQPNMTGTTGAYRPPGHVLSGGRRDGATGDYEAWTPPE
ncbi:MAG: NADH:ubiquinone oxidoreductase subunit NDUFA12 [Rhodospirillales bacterium]|nr:NADH:ubiquinone oxidoreductase subunit NDUFA12 [Rhodospirillales bacterium]MCB9997210.1 NADH:ubiquinone oxidoreductase subunit NDUFA12 [Rhodospirillales bacterium]